MMQLSHALYDSNLHPSNSNCTTRKTGVSSFLDMSVERKNKRQKTVSGELQ